MGQIWGSTSCGGDEVEKRAHYWVAVDYLNKARAADPTLAEDAAVQIGKGPVIAAGVDKELDELRALSTDSKEYLLRMQQREAERTGM